MIIAVCLLVAVAAILLLQAVLGWRMQGLLGAFIFLQAAYLGLSWTARPLILLVVQPAPRRGDSVADARLATLGYERVLSELLFLAVLGLGASLLVYLLVRRRAVHWVVSSQLAVDGVVVILVVGWIFRLASLVLPGNGVVETLSLLAAVSTGALIVFGGALVTRRRVVLVTLAVFGELSWSIISATKAPIMACGLWVIVRLFARKGVRAGHMAAAAACGFVAFVAIQEVKVSAGLLESNQRFEAAYPLIARPLLYIIRRFDHVSATSDALFAGPGRWLSWSEILQQLLMAFVPQQLIAAKGENIGARWATEVRAYSVPNSNTGVHLAEGPIAEGYVLAGSWGVVAESVVVAVIAVLVCRGMAGRGPYLKFFGLAIMTQPILFERGVLGVSEGMGKSIQVSLICAALFMFTRLVNGDVIPSVTQKPHSTNEVPHVRPTELSTASGDGSSPRRATTPVAQPHCENGRSRVVAPRHRSWTSSVCGGLPSRRWTASK